MSNWMSINSVKFMLPVTCNDLESLDIKFIYSIRLNIEQYNSLSMKGYLVECYLNYKNTPILIKNCNSGQFIQLADVKNIKLTSYLANVLLN